MSKWPFEASVQGLRQQCVLLLLKYREPTECGWSITLRDEYRFHSCRKWRADVAFPELKILAEYHGGLFLPRKGGHQTVRGARNDWEKFNEAQLMGFVCLQFGPDETRSGEAMNVVELAIQAALKGKAA